MKKQRKGFTDHHLVYEVKEKRQDEITVPIKNKEHYVVSLLQRYRYVSYGFFIAVLYELIKLLIKKIHPILLNDVKPKE